MKKSQLLLSLTTILSGLFMLGFIVAGFLIVQFSRELPDAHSIKSVELKVPLRVFSADQLLISEFGNERRKPLSYENMPQSLIDSVLASEDDGFFEHSGIDIKGLLRAAISNFRTGRSGQGASTITMQVARNFFLTRDKTYTRKLKEVMLAIRLEQILSKQEILSLYLNKIFLGHRSYGFAAAAEVYYGKPLIELSKAQIAMLAGLPKAPSTYNPIRNPERALLRRNYVLGRLKDLDKITETQYETAISEPISAEKHKKKSELVAPHIAEMVRAQLTEQYGEDAYWQGLNVYTTILSEQQNAAEAALRKGLQQYDRRHGFRGAVGKIDLKQLKPLDEADTNMDSAFEEALSIYPRSHEQVPALVLSSEDTTASAWSSENGEVTLELETSKWAKRHKTANLVGDRPKKMSDLVAPGDVVYIRPEVVSIEKEPPSTDEGVTRWELSQIPNVGGALISMQPSTGKVLSLVGGYDFFLNKYNRAVQSIRQPGSNIKPFIYSASLDKGFTPASLISGAPIVITDPSHGTLWRPENYSGKFYGPTRMREALGKSMNLVSIRLLRAIGIPYAREYVSRFGIDMNRFSATLTMALGSGGVTPMEMLSAYSVLANGGYRVQPYFIERITDRDGVTIFQAPQPEFCDECFAEFLPKPEIDEEAENVLAEDLPKNDNDLEAVEQEPAVQDEANQEDQSVSVYQAPRVMSHANNFLTVSMMKDVINRGTARKALALERTDLAGKTGTTNDYVDAWFTGFNSKIATTVWVGFDEPATMGKGEAGSLTALPIWVNYMRSALEGVERDTSVVPGFIEEGIVNRTSGKRTDELDPGAITEYFVIDQLTPEFALLQELYPNALSAQDINKQSCDLSQGQECSGLLYDSTSINDSSSDQELQPEINQQDRIIEESEDTEGLF